MFTFTFSDAVIRSREAQTSEKRACVPIVEQGKLSSQEKKHPLHAHMYYKLEWDMCRSMLAPIDSSLFVSLSQQLLQMSVVTFTQGFHSHFLFNTSLYLDSIIQ